MKTIELSFGADSPVHLNADQIVYFTPLADDAGDAGSEIVLASGSAVQVTQTPAELIALLGTAPELKIELG